MPKDNYYNTTRPSPEGCQFNSGLAKVAVQCSADTFVVNQTLGLRINICGKNRQLLVAANRVCLESMSSTNIECFTKDGR